MDKQSAIRMLGAIALLCIVAIVAIVYLAQGRGLTQSELIAITMLGQMATGCVSAIAGFITGDYLDKKPKDDKQTANK